MFSAKAVDSGLIWAEMSFMAAIWPPRARPDSARVKYITLNVQVQGSEETISMMMTIDQDKLENLELFHVGW